MPPCYQALHSTDWMDAITLAVLRKTHNDAIRRTHRHRGEQLNRLGEVQGAIGEIIAAAYLREKGCEVIRWVPYSTQGPVSEADMTFRYQGRVYALDVKAMFLTPRQRNLLINRNAHEQERKRVNLYLPILLQSGSTWAAIGRGIPPREVSEHWRHWDLPYGDPAYACHIRQAAPSYFNASLRQIEWRTQPRLGWQALRRATERLYAGGHVLLEAYQQGDAPLARLDLDSKQRQAVSASLARIRAGFVATATEPNGKRIAS